MGGITASQSLCSESPQSEVDPQDEDDWQNQHKWMASKLTKFNEVFREILQELDPTDYDEHPEDVEDVEELGGAGEA